MIQALSIKCALWFGSMFLTTFSDWKAWVWYLNILDQAEDEQQAGAARQWIHKNAPFRVEAACFIVYYAFRDPASFLLSLMLIVGAFMYLVYFVVSDLIMRFVLGG